MKTQLRILTALALFGFSLLALGAPAQTQPPLDTSDLEGFLSLSAVTGQPTLVVKPESRDIALAQMGARRLSSDLYSIKDLGQQIIFGILLDPVPVDRLPVADERDKDIKTMTYSRRTCARVKEASPVPGANCVEQADGTYLLWTNAAVDRCSKGGVDTCTEVRVVTSQLHYFYDAQCTLEIPGICEQGTGLRCAYHGL